jgi:hypothetical protein
MCRFLQVKSTKNVNARRENQRRDAKGLALYCEAAPANRAVEKFTFGKQAPSQARGASRHGVEQDTKMTLRA